MDTLIRLVKDSKTRFELDYKTACRVKNLTTWENLSNKSLEYLKNVATQVKTIMGQHKDNSDTYSKILPQVTEKVKNLKDQEVPKCIECLKEMDDINKLLKNIGEEYNTISKDIDKVMVDRFGISFL